MPKRLKLSRPSHATTVAYLALFVALGGSAYAVKQLPKNSVGTKQLKKNAVTKVKIKKNSVNGPRVRNNSLTGADIKLSKLGTVPSAKSAGTAETANTANTAGTANLANSLPPLEATHLVGAPGEPPFENGSGPAPSEIDGLQPVGFYRDYEGIVHLQGFAQVGGPIPKIFTLPEGYRPASTKFLFFTVFCISGECEDSGGNDENYSNALIVGSNVSDEGLGAGGAVIGSPNTVVSLDGITFRAES